MAIATIADVIRTHGAERPDDPALAGLLRQAARGDRSALPGVKKLLANATNRRVLGDVADHARGQEQRACRLSRYADPVGRDAWKGLVRVGSLGAPRGRA